MSADPEATKDDLILHLRSVHGWKIENPQRTTKATLVEDHRSAHRREAEADARWFHSPETHP